jgi:hypothetical protein
VPDRYHISVNLLYRPENDIDTTQSGQNRCCTNGFELADVYNGGAAFMAFLAEEFGEGVHDRILRSGAPTFEEALTSETKPRLQSELLARFRG